MGNELSLFLAIISVIYVLIKWSLNDNIDGSIYPGIIICIPIIIYLILLNTYYKIKSKLKKEIYKLQLLYNTIFIVIILVYCWYLSKPGINVLGYINEVLLLAVVLIYVCFLEISIKLKNNEIKINLVDSFLIIVSTIVIHGVLFGLYFGTENEIHKNIKEPLFIFQDNITNKNMLSQSDEYSIDFKANYINLNENNKIFNEIVEKIVKNLKNNSKVKIFILYFSNYEPDQSYVLEKASEVTLSKERAISVKGTIINILNDYLEDHHMEYLQYNNNVRFELLNYSCNENVTNETYLKNRIKINIYIDTLESNPRLLDYLYSSLAFVNGIKANTKLAKFIITIKDISNILLSTLLLGVYIPLVIREIVREDKENG